MKRIALSAMTLTLAYLGMPGDAKAAADRFYVATISPSVTVVSTPVLYKLSVTNDIQSGSSHFIRQIALTVPAAFSLVNIPSTNSPITLPPFWKVQSITG